jgi:Flp pilus assembly pilin Flp
MWLRLVHGPSVEAGDQEAGATSVEYAIMVGAIAAVVIAIVITLGIRTGGLFDMLVSRWNL